MDDKTSMYSETVTYSDYLFACREEIEIEAMMLELLAKDTKEHQQEIEAARLALLKFDRLDLEPELKATQVAIRHECEEGDRELEQKFYAENPQISKRCTEDYIRKIRENGGYFDNFRRGLKSSDPNERAKYQAFERKFITPETNVADIMPALQLFAPARKNDGRPQLNPSWRKIDFELKEIRRKIPEKPSKAKAIEEVALVTKSIGGGHQNKIDRLRTAYNAKMKLREKT